MKRFVNWKIVAIILFALTLAYYDAPSSWQKLPFTPSFIKESKIPLGLDLQGGTQLDYKIDVSKVPLEDQKDIIEGVREVIGRRVNGLGVSEPNIYLSDVADEKHIIVELAGIKDIDQAKATVGKTIQLEFKEEKGAPDPKEQETIKAEANTVYRDVLKSPDTFATKGTELMNSNPRRVAYQEMVDKELVNIQDPNFNNALKTMRAGEIRYLSSETSLGYELTPEGAIREQKGYVIVKLLEKKTEPKEEKVGKSVDASHLLVAYKGATRADATLTRTKEQALKRASDILEKIRKGELTFEAAAREFSDEKGSETTSGKLPEPVKEGSNYVGQFVTGALKLEQAGQISDIVETEFGFHIIKANAITPERIEKKNVEKLRFQAILFSSMPGEWRDTKLNGEHFKHADVQFTDIGGVQVAIRFTEEGAKLFEDLTAKNIGKRIGIFVGGDMISAPTVNNKIAGGQAVITGTSTPQQGQELARDLNTGAIPAPVTIAGQHSIGASLGQEALDQSLKAGILGVVLLMIFMLLYYRLPGLVANIALAMYSVVFLFVIKSALPLPIALLAAIVIFVAIVYKVLNSDDGAGEKLPTFVLGCFILFFVTFLLSTPIVLTLAGIAGVILFIGMAVDANVLIFERLKEELRHGRPLSSAIEIGFDKAWSSIRDSNFSSLITCAILYYFGSSIVRGFALTLAAGILISMFTAISVTKTLLESVVKTRLANNLWL